MTSFFKSMYEAPEVEAARLATAPVGSINHTLSTLPVNIHTWLEDLMIQLPNKPREDGTGEHTMIVVPFDRFKEEPQVEGEKWKLHRGSWRCIVVASDHPSYPVGGHRLCVSEAELVRGTLRTFETANAAAI